MDLRDYEQHKFAIAEALRSASKSVASDQRDWHEVAQDAFARLAEDRFNLVVVGRFSRGKTSLMNAIMGTDRLPTGIVPLTSVITTVGYGSKEQAVLSYEGRILTSEISLDSLSQYITQEGNPGNLQRIKKAEVQLPAEILRRGFYFVDTPGLGSAIIENTRTTENFLSEADAFILVTSYESPLSDEEMRFFRIAASSARRVFIVLNKHDTVTPDERRAAIAYVKNQLSSLLAQQEPQIFSVSARDGLDAKRSEDSELLKKSGLPALESELVEFLLREKSTAFLLAMCDRVFGLIQRLPASSKTQDLVEKIRTLSRQIADDQSDLRRLSLELTGLPALENIQQLRSCEICAHVNQALWDFLSKFQYDLSISQEVQRRFAERHGLCSFHTWQYESIASPQGTCTGYPPLLDDLAKRLRKGAGTQLPHALLPGDIEDLLSNRDGCVMCMVRAKAEEEAIAKSSRRITKDPRRVEPLSAICLPHLGLLLPAIEDSNLVRTLLDREATILERLSEDMKRYALKRDAVRRSLLSDEETAAAHRALLLLAGHRNVTATCHSNAVRSMPAASPLADVGPSDRSEEPSQPLEGVPP